MTTDLFPADQWERLSAAEAGWSAAKLERVRDWLATSGEGAYRLAIVHRGRLVFEWYQSLEAEVHRPIASAAKSIYSNVLGIAVAEGVLPSVDAPVVDYFPEMMDVPQGRGPKEGRYAFAKDEAITFRQLISNTSGYMKPDEEPGRVFHYQTYGMNILTHAVAKAYGLYDVADPEGGPGFARLVADKLAAPIGADWSYTATNFSLQEGANLPVFGYYCQIHTQPLDWLRLGWLWCNGGRWGDKQVIPTDWLAESTAVEGAILAHCPEDEWQYGCGFWTNSHGKLWPGLPRSGFTASGAGGHYLTVFPEQELVVAQNPGLYIKDESGSTAGANQILLTLLLDAAAG
ncbi:MAG: serine hydrolase [Candidatus Latescibacteria bacterium]|nr:serine hydrolase [Candidatus Latescibacterota bacterium]